MSARRDFCDADFHRQLKALGIVKSATMFSKAVIGMYHCDPKIALEELNEDALLLNPVHLRDMILRTDLSPKQALEMNRGLEEYLRRFGELQNLLRPILEELAELPHRV